MTELIQIFIVLLLIIFAIIGLIIFLTNNAQQEAVKRADRHAKQDSSMVNAFVDIIKTLPNADNIIIECQNKVAQLFKDQNEQNRKSN
jgi:CHASE1-domain containing sensor protein